MTTTIKTCINRLLFWFAPDRLPLATRVEMAVPGLSAEWGGGNCPVQIEGKLDGHPFYFRARGDRATLSVANEKTGDPLSYETCRVYATDYGTWPDAGWMPDSDVVRIIKEAVAVLRDE